MATPPGARETLAGEIIAFSHKDGQVGLPPAISTDATPGISATAYQISEIHFDHLEGDKFALVRLEGNTSRGRGRAKAESTQRAKVGYCVCCTYAAHVAAPAAYDVGEFSNVKARDLELWTPLGPWAPRRSAAYL